MQLQNPAITETIQRHIESGQYESPDDVVMHALQKLDDYIETVADLRESLTDEEAGRVRPLSEIADQRSQ